MTVLKEKILKKILRRPAAVVFLLSLLAVLAPLKKAAALILTVAAGASIVAWAKGLLASAAAKTALFINQLIASLASMIIVVEAWFVELFLNINTRVVSSSIVQNGFEVTLSIANLGFVTAIIVIAIATILRSQTYGIKQILWKLIVAALLVNFSLVIAGVIINFADQLTSLFLTPFQGDTAKFAEDIVAGFQPQRYLNPQEKTNSPPGGDWEGFASASGGTFGATMAPLVSIFTAVLGLTMLVVVMGALVVLLLVRYIYLAMLLILMPLAWVAWIFPAWSGQWSNWWRKFFRWTFFAPIVVFFMWLVAVTGSAINQKNPDSPFSGETVNIESGGDSAAAALSTIFSTTFTPIVETLLTGLLLSGLMVGGLIAANSLSITGAGVALGAAQGAARGLGRMTVKGGKKFGGWGLRKTGMDTRAQNWGNKLAGTGALGRVMARPLVKGASAVKAAGGEKLIAEAEAKQAKAPTSQLLDTWKVMSREEKIAFARRLDKENKIDTLDPQELGRFFGRENEGVFKRYGQEEFYKNIRNKTALHLTDTLQPNLKSAKAGGSPAEILAAEEAIFKYFKAAPDPGLLGDLYFPGKEKEDRMIAQGKLPGGVSEPEYRELQETIAKNLLSQSSTQTVSSLLNKLSRADALDQFAEAIDRAGVNVADLTEGTKNWFGGNAARNLGVTTDSLKIKP